MHLYYFSEGKAHFICYPIIGLCFWCPYSQKKKKHQNDILFNIKQCSYFPSEQGNQVLLNCTARKNVTTFRLGLWKKIRNSMKAWKFYNRSKGVSLGACQAGSTMFYKPQCQFLAQNEEPTSRDVVWGKWMSCSLVAEWHTRVPSWCSQGTGCCLGSQISGGFSALLAALEQFFLLVWPRNHILDMKV